MKGEDAGHKSSISCSARAPNSRDAPIVTLGARAPNSLGRGFRPSSVPAPPGAERTKRAEELLKRRGSGEMDWEYISLPPAPPPRILHPLRP